MIICDSSVELTLRKIGEGDKMEVFAYLDPGTGSLILQVVIGGILGIGVVLKTYWAKIVGIFSKKSATKTKSSKSAE